MPGTEDGAGLAVAAGTGQGSPSGSGAQQNVENVSQTTDRGNGAQVKIDPALKVTMSKQEAIASRELQTGIGRVTEHGDVGRAGSYRLADGGVVES